MPIIEEKVRKIVLDVMGMDINRIDHSKSLKDVEEWDSFNNLMVVSEIENAFGIKFTANDIYGVDTISKIMGIVAKKLEKSENKG
ncbi:acyl carrier protein [Candidatus Woesearchaeota archaeon]|nr:acyl carrier protein [Candidatus Woesearchaeota archaeon]